MEVEDLPSVLAIESQSFPNPWHESTFRGEIQHRPISFPLAVVHSRLNKVIGYIIFWQVGEDVQVNNIAIHPDFRRLGIGEAVLKQVIELVRWRGARLVTLEVRPSNTAALSLYRKLGFKMMGVRKGYYTNPPEDAFVLSLHL
ncbi:MAG: ribosomal protein S18-alanine N-acetyltransferase [Clostridiales bacterium]|jgi:ribosomal-protein-alanine N-acetyltransferase|nr:ribosomal protein S18-alanine N-acetyltransferase [Clostridiales bacterium]